MGAWQRPYHYRSSIGKKKGKEGSIGKRRDGFGRNWWGKEELAKAKSTGKAAEC